VYEMSENRTDTPYAPSALIEEEAKPVWWFVYAHYSLVGLMTLPFLYSLYHVVICVITFPGGPMTPRPGLPEALLIVGFIGLLFRKKWAYMICVIVSLIVEALYLVYHSVWQLPPFVVLGMIWFGLILVSASICALTCRRQKTGRD